MQQTTVIPGLVSIVIPAFNAAAWIEETLASALAQTYPHTEIIVADNGSTDGTRETVARYAGRVRLVDAPIRGCGAARNAGLAVARGEYVQLLDADDLLEPWKIERQVAVLHGTDADVVWGPFWTYERQAGGRFAPHRHRVPRIDEADLEASVLRADGWIQMGAMLLRRTPRVRALRFEPAHRIEDVRFQLALLLAGGRFVRGQGDSGLLFREHDGVRASTVPNERLLLGVFDNASFAEEEWRRRGTLTPARVELLTDLYLWSLRGLHGLRPAEFAVVHAHLQQLNPAYVRRLPPKLRLVAQVLGYPRTEELASAFRRVRAGLQAIA